MNFKIAQEIRLEYHNTTIRQKALAEKYNATQGQISKIINNQLFNPPRPKQVHVAKMRGEGDLHMMVVWVKPEDIVKVRALDHTRWWRE